MADLPRIRIDEDAHQAWLGDRELPLSPLNFNLLRYLALNAGRALTRSQILREVWGSDVGIDGKTLDMHVSWLRKNLGDDAAKPRYITTVRGVGFRLEDGTVEGFVRPPQADPTRVLLIKPGDVLVFGNLGTVPDVVRAAAAELRNQLRLASVVLFAGDIDMAAVTTGSTDG